MQSTLKRSMLALVALAAIATAVASATPTAAQPWTRVLDVPPKNVFSLVSLDDTLLAGTDTSVYVSVDGGTTFRASRRPGTGVPILQSTLMHNGRLFVGTAGQGVFVSNDRGASWAAFNQGLVGGLFDTQLDVADLEVRGDSLFAATLGAGVWVRSLTGAGATWHTFGSEFEPNQAANVASLAVGGTRLLACAGGNGSVFRRDPGNPEWTISWLDNVGLRPGLEAKEAAFNGHAWVVGTIRGVHRSTAGQEPWSLFDPGLGPLQHVAFGVQKNFLFAAFDIVNAVAIESSLDDGVTWHLMEVLPQAFVFRMASARNELFAARADGLWRRALDTVSAGDGASAPSALRLAVVGRQPVGDDVRLHFALPEAAHASIALYDVRGRRVAPVVNGDWPAGDQIVALDARGLRPGVYEALLVAGGRRAVTRIVHER
jgi:hypothetical protein